MKGAAVALALLALVIALQTVPVERPLARLTGRVHDLGPWGPAAFGLAFVVLTCLLLPATPVVLAAGAVFGPAVTTVLVSAASTLAAAVSFGVGRRLGRRRMARWVGHYPKVHALYHALGGAGGWKIVAAVRLSHAAPFGVQNYLFGASPVRFWPFLLATWVTMLPGTIFYAYVGHAGAEAVTEATAGAPAGPEKWLERGVFLAVAAAALAYVTHFAKRVMREQLGEKPS